MIFLDFWDSFQFEPFIWPNPSLAIFQLVKKYKAASGGPYGRMKPHFTITVDSAPIADKQNSNLSACGRSKNRASCKKSLGKVFLFARSLNATASTAPEQYRVAFQQIGSAACAPINRRRGRKLRAAPAVFW
ncbi:MULTISPECIES: hypothetical protein [Rhizobium]|uniref:Uncharacterized protein n=2 Tax=Rhizobium TaxID=379 RepID=A0A7X0DWA3_RHILE|nr:MULTISPECIES: hypothetical protein [Rhizobium]MBB5668109.1 hypothetical protein [Rhizobium leguminosarum]MBB6225446.1 hypothetical protein [Rhizobium leguminosarum]MBY4593463.1 hypothetical protein [Rhizobium redzepovicii]MBY4611775.1 hypothetical protein [Rhizobium croatiense]MBY4618163.1 hypothetical protein [Rhizobium redzepovicii]